MVFHSIKSEVFYISMAFAFSLLYRMDYFANSFLVQFYTSIKTQTYHNT